MISDENPISIPIPVTKRKRLGKRKQLTPHYPESIGNDVYGCVWVYGLWVNECMGMDMKWDWP
ncbi:hypothetical protein EON63_09150 [archaeon]|nr:MAG: hypothetical protein EON63_09150 [archaeon]